MSKGSELQRVGRHIFGRNNLIGTDFEDVSAWKIDRKFVQTSSGGILIQFAISHHALEKIATEELDKALAALLEEGRYVNESTTSNRSVEEYMADQTKFWEDRQNDEAFAKADNKERERQAMKVVGKAYKMLTSKQFGFSGNKAAEVILEYSLLEKHGFTLDEARSLVASYLETEQRKLAELREFNRRQNEGGGNLV